MNESQWIVISENDNSCNSRCYLTFEVMKSKDERYTFYPNGRVISLMFVKHFRIVINRMINTIGIFL